LLYFGLDRVHIGFGLGFENASLANVHGLYTKACECVLWHATAAADVGLMKANRAVEPCIGGSVELHLR